MDDPRNASNAPLMVSLATHLTETVAAVFAAHDLPPTLGQVAVSDRPDLGQFQCNGALAGAKTLKKPPRQIAEAIAEALRRDDRLATVSIAGPGFINLTLTDGFLAAFLDARRTDPRLGVPLKGDPQTVMLDYGGPNIAKPMHVGHLRASIIGDSLRRLFAYAGDRTIGDVHMGDWGLPMGMLISEIALREPTLSYFADPAPESFPNTSPVTLEDLEALYPAAAGACKADPARLDTPVTPRFGSTSSASRSPPCASISSRWGCISTSTRARPRPTRISRR